MSRLLKCKERVYFTIKSFESLSVLDKKETPYLLILNKVKLDLSIWKAIENSQPFK